MKSVDDDEYLYDVMKDSFHCCYDYELECYCLSSYRLMIVHLQSTIRVCHHHMHPYYLSHRMNILILVPLYTLDYYHDDVDDDVVDHSNLIFDPYNHV